MLPGNPTSLLTVLGKEQREERLGERKKGRSTGHCGWRRAMRVLSRGAWAQLLAPAARTRFSLTRSSQDAMLSSSLQVFGREYWTLSAAQSRLFSSRPNWVCPPPPLWFGEVEHIRLQKKGLGESQLGRVNRHCGTLGTFRMYFVVSTYYGRSMGQSLQNTVQ